MKTKRMIGLGCEKKFQIRSKRSKGIEVRTQSTMAEKVEKGRAGFSSSEDPRKNVPFPAPCFFPLWVSEWRIHMIRFRTWENKNLTSCLSTFWIDKKNRFSKTKTKPLR